MVVFAIKSLLFLFYFLLKTYKGFDLVNPFLTGNITQRSFTNMTVYSSEETFL